MSAAFTAEFIEASGRTEREMSAAFTAEFIEASGRTEKSMKYEIVKFTKQECTVFTQSYIIPENTQRYFFIHCDKQCTSKAIDLSFVVHRNAFLRVEFLLVHTSCTFSIACILQGEGAEVMINGAYVLGADNKVSIVTRQQHDSPRATSKVVVKGALYDTAYASYTGMICVPKESHSTVASQENKNILIGHSAKAISVPQLEVLTNDVHCFHGSAIGRLDSGHVFYAAARGIDHKVAERLLLTGFFADVFENDHAKESLEKYL